MNPDDEEFGFEADDVGFEADDLPGAAELPAAYRETGERNIVHQLPGMTITGTPEGTGSVTYSDAAPVTYEERTVAKRPSAHDVRPGTIVGEDQRTAWERVRDEAPGMALSVAGALTGPAGMVATSPALPEIAGRDPVTPETLRRAAAALRGGQGRGLDALDEALRVGMPTAAMPEGRESEPDYRTQAVWRGLGSAVLLGHADELGAALGGGTGDTYAERRDALRAESTTSAEQAPTGTTMGAVAGSAPLAILPGGQTTALGRVGAASGYGAATGAVRGLGESEADDLPGMALDSGTGALVEGGLGAAGGVLGEGVNAGLRAAQPGGALSRAAASARMEASGLLPNPSPNTTYGQEIRRMGGQERVAELLEQHRVGGRFPTAAGTREAAERLTVEAGEAFDDVIRQMDDAGGGVPVDDLLRRFDGIGERLRQSSLAPMRRAAESFDRTIAPLRARAGQRMTWAEAQRFRSELGQLGAFETRATSPSQASAAGSARQAWGQTTDALDDAASAVDPAIRDQWRGANERYQLASMLERRAREEGSRFSGAIAEGVRMASGDPVSAMAARTGGHYLSRVGGALRARGLVGLTAALREVGGEVFAEVLEGAARTRGPSAAAAAHYVLLRTRPGYRESVERATEAQEEVRSSHDR